MTVISLSENPNSSHSYQKEDIALSEKFEVNGISLGRNVKVLITSKSKSFSGVLKKGL